MTALLDGTEGGNWEFAGKLVEDYTSDDGATGELMTGFINLAMVLVETVQHLSDESAEGVLSVTAHSIAANSGSH
jgi:hypothetical protein